MARLDPVTVEDLDREQRALHDIIAGTRGGSLGGPLSVLIRTPHIADPANELHNAFRLNGRLDRHIFEMLVIVVARHHRTEFAWEIHARLALKAGLDSTIIETIRIGGDPVFTQPDERFVYDLTIQLLKNSTLDQPSYDHAAEMLGINHLIEVVSAVGFYSMLCLILNTFGVVAPSGEHPLAGAE
jgi:4-carboxymuconolactone decarboxylase